MSSTTPGAICVGKLYYKTISNVNQANESTVGGSRLQDISTGMRARLPDTQCPSAGCVEIGTSLSEFPQHAGATCAPTTPPNQQDGDHDFQSITLGNASAMANCNSPSDMVVVREVLSLQMQSSTSIHKYGG